MGLEDKIKGLVDKGKQLVTDNAEKLESAVDKAGDFIDDKTGGKFAEHIDKVQDAAKNAIPDKDPVADVKDAAGTAAENVKDAAGTAAENVKDAAAEVKDAVDGK